MKKFEVQIALEGVAETRKAWTQAWAKFTADVEQVMSRLINEAMVNYMSAEEVAKHSGMSVKQVRVLMRKHGLDHRSGKRLLSRQASAVLSENAALLGIEPHEMDMLSPLAYLPMGSALRESIEQARNEQITFPETLGPEAEQMAGKLTDAGLSWQEARDWIREVIAEAGA